MESKASKETSREIRCLFDSNKMCLENCKLKDFIEIAMALGAVQQNAQNPKDHNLEANCKLKQN